ncbi:hypothetical protein STEG23_036903 [Scotinomys teguina]
MCFRMGKLKSEKITVTIPRLHSCKTRSRSKYLSHLITCFALSRIGSREERGALLGQQTTDPGSTCSVCTVGSSRKDIQAPRTPYLQCRILQPGRPLGQHPRASFLQLLCCECCDVIRRRTPRCHVMSLESCGWE